MRALLLVTVITACGSSEVVNQTPQAVAVVQRGAADETLRIAVASPEYLARIPEVFTDAPPRDFRWIEVDIPASLRERVFSPDGVTADLTDATSTIQFAQTYTEACNPRIGDYTVCWYVERLIAGVDGVTGVLQLTGTSTELTASIDVTSKSYTTQWGDPPYYYEHGTTSGFTAIFASGLTQ